MASGRLRQAGAFAASLLMHAAVLASVIAWGRRSAEERPAPGDVWSGRTVAIDALWAEPAAATGASAAPGDAPAAGAGEARVTEAEPLPGNATAETTPPADESSKENDDAPAEGPPAPAPRADSAQSAGEDERTSPHDLTDPGSDPKAEPEQQSAEPSAEPAQQPADPNAALRAKILGYRPEAPGADESEEPAAPAATGSPFGGMDAEAPKARSLPGAFTRAIPAANTRDPAWRRLPLGRAGTVRVVLRIDDSGRLGRPQFIGEPRAHLERLVERTWLALRGGRFALAGGETGEVEMTLRVVLSQRRRGEGPLELGFEAPRRNQPGRAYFQLPGGRFVDVEVSVGR